ncbi:MAG: IPT/TIG domain-containing protein, partial [Candidatus Poseidoniales archaeon]
MRTGLYLVTLLLLSVSFGHIVTSNDEGFIDAVFDFGEDSRNSAARSSSYTVSPASGWTTGGEEMTITGSGFTDLAFSNTTDDGINHQWVETTMDYTDE